jgi:hypothetical protein
MISITVAGLLALIGLTPGILALLGAPSIGALVALSVTDKVTLATTVIGLLPHDAKTLKAIHGVLHQEATMVSGVLHQQAGAEGYITMEYDVGGRGPCAWGCYPELKAVWHPLEKRHAHPLRSRH